MITPQRQLELAAALRSIATALRHTYRMGRYPDTVEHIAIELEADHAGLEVEEYRDRQNHERMLHEHLESRQLHRLVGELRAIGKSIGARVAFWEVVFNIETHLKGGNSMMGRTTSELIVYAEQMLKDTRHG